MSDFDKVFEQVWNVNLFSNYSADLIKVLEQTEEIMNDEEYCTGNYGPFDGTYFAVILASIGLVLGIRTLVCITKTIFPTKNLSEAHC